MVKFVECRVLMNDSRSRGREKILLNADFVKRIYVRNDPWYRDYGGDGDHMGWDVLLTETAGDGYITTYAYCSCADEDTAINEMKKLAELLND